MESYMVIYYQDTAFVFWSSADGSEFTAIDEK